MHELGHQHGIEKHPSEFQTPIVGDNANLMEPNDGEGDVQYQVLGGNNPVKKGVLGNDYDIKKNKMLRYFRKYAWDDINKHYQN